MRGVAFVILIVSFIGVANATSRWGDDFDWLGDTVVNHEMASIVHLGGDTLLCMSKWDGLWGLRQTGDSTFQELFALPLPPYSPDVPCLLSDSSNRLFYGFPNGKLHWDRPGIPRYNGTIHRGLSFSPDSLFSVNLFGTSGDSAYFDSISYIFPGPPSPNNVPVFSHDRILHRDRVYRLNALSIVDTFAIVPGVNDWAVRWPYAYGVSLVNNQLVTVDLSTFPPVEMSRLPIVTAGFAQILRDTLITVQGPRWESWSLAAPSQPVSLGITPLPFHLHWIENTAADSLYFGWGGRHGYSTMSFYEQFTAYLFSFTPSVLTPRLVDSLRIGIYAGPPLPSQVVRTSYGWIGRTSIGNSLTRSQYFGIDQYWDVNRVRLRLLWSTITPGAFLNNEHQKGYTCTLRTDTTLWHPYDGANAFWDAFSYNPDNNRFTHLPAVPFRFRQVWHNMVYGDGKIGRWENNQWQVDSLHTRTGSPEFFSYHTLLFQDDHLINRFWINNTAVFRVFRIENDSALYESGGNIPWDGSTYYLRDSTLICGTTPTTLGILQQSGATWSCIPGWEARLDSFVNFTTATKWDTLFLFGQKLYALPSTGSPYPVLDLAPLARVLPEPRQSNYQIDIEGNTVLVALPNSFCGVYYVSNDTAILRGAILKGGNQPNLIGNTAILTGRDGISSYVIPPYNAVNDYFSSSLPTEYKFHSPYPNPFNSICLFHFTLPRTGNTGFTIYDLLGREVYKREMGSLQAGKYLASWNGGNSTGQAASSGVYFLRFHSGNFQSVKKIVMVK